MNDIWGGDALTEWGKSFWELSIAQGERLLERAVHTHIITSRHGAPLMVARNAGLIVEVTDGDTYGYRGNLFYDLAKNAVVRLAYAMAADLHPHGVTALAITPGFLRSEAVLDHFGVTEANWRDGHREGRVLRRVRDPVLRRPRHRRPRRRPERRGEERRAVLELDPREGVRLLRHRRTPTRLGHVLPEEGAGNPRTGRTAGRDGCLRHPQPALPGGTRPVRQRGGRPPPRLARPPRVADPEVQSRRPVNLRIGQKPMDFDTFAARTRSTVMPAAMSRRSV